MIPSKLQHRLVVVDMDKMVLKKIVEKESIIRRRMWKLNKNPNKGKIRQKSERSSNQTCLICGKLTAMKF